MAAAIIPEGIQDDKAQHVIPFILDLYSRHEARYASNSSPPPLIVGLTAPQGAGKSLLVSMLNTSLAKEHNLPTTIFSLDDFYLPYRELKDVATNNPSNPLLQHRGQPGTHDTALAREVFSSLCKSQPTAIPQFNKAAYSGFGDRVPKEDWTTVNSDSTKPVRIILFEGWCVGFRALPSSMMSDTHERAVTGARDQSSGYKGRLGHNNLESVSAVNKALSEYDALTKQFDGLIHIDAEDPLYVYEWRLEQEHNLIKAKGSGMSDAEVKNFVDGYYPSYELYVSGLREGVFKTLERDGAVSDWKGRQLRLVVGRDRKVKNVERI